MLSSPSVVPSLGRSDLTDEDIVSLNRIKRIFAYVKPERGSDLPEDLLNLKRLAHDIIFD